MPERIAAALPAPRVAAWPQGLVLVTVNTMPILAMASLVPSLPRMLQHFRALPGHEVLVPMILTIPTLCIGLFASLAGALADRFGRRRLLIGALCVFATVGLAPLLFSDIYLILVSRFAVGLAEACIPTCGNALMGDYFSGEHRKRWLAYQAIAGPSIGSVVLLGGGALGSISWRLPFVIYAIGGGLVLLAVSWLLFEPARAAQGPRAAALQSAAQTPFPWKSALQVGSVTLLTALLFFLQNVQHGRIFAGLGVESPGRISVLVMLASLGTIVGGYAFKKTPLQRIEQLLAIVYVGFGISYIGLYLAPTVAVGTLLDGVGQFAGGFSFPVLLWWTLGKFATPYRGRGAGIWSGCFYVGSFTSPLVTSLIGRWTPTFLATVGVLGVYALIVGLALSAWSLLTRGRSASQPLIAPPL